MGSALAVLFAPPTLLWLLRRLSGRSRWVGLVTVGGCGVYVLALLMLAALVGYRLVRAGRGGAGGEVATVAYAREINETATVHGVDPRLLAAIVQVESRYDPKAISLAGAEGLGQLTPTIQQACGLTDPFDAAANLNCSAWFLAYLIEKYQDRDVAVAAYHAGEPLVDACGGCIPRPVDAGYVRSVLAAYRQIPMVPIRAKSAGVVWPYEETPRLTGASLHGLPGWQGVDVARGCGTKLVAPVTGRVAYVGRDGYVGPYSNGQQNSMLTLHADDDHTSVTMFHGHYSVKAGDRVTAGVTVIGTEGRVGNATGCHTHLVVKSDGRVVNPIAMIER